MIAAAIAAGSLVVAVSASAARRSPGDDRRPSTGVLAERVQLHAEDRTVSKGATGSRAFTVTNKGKLEARLQDRGQEDLLIAPGADEDLAGHLLRGRAARCICT